MKTIFWDDGMTILTSVSAENAVGQPISSVFNEDDYDEFLMSLLREACRGRPSVNQQMSYQLNDGSESLLLLSVTPHLDDQSCVTGAIVEMMNITSLSYQRLQELMHSKHVLQGLHS